jgi:hypothetical protein
MSTASVLPKPTTIFQSKGIEDIGLIDDAYDPLLLGNIPEVDLNSFWAALEQEESLLIKIRQAGILLHTKADINDNALQQLWLQRELITGLEGFLQILSKTRASMIKDVEEIRANIEALHLNVQEAGTATNLADEGRCKIILLDYFLGEGDERAIDASIAKATQIYERSEKRGEYPVFVLMSSSTLSLAQVEQFRKKSRLIGGIFHHIPKSDLKNQKMLERKLMAIAMSLPIAPSMVSLIEAVERALTSARQTFSDRMRDLSLEDYAYIDRLSLKEDGQPFGDYILWLFSAELQKLIFESEDVQAQRNRVDKTSFPSLPVKQLVPSKNLALMYRTALFQEMPPEIPVHPLGDKENEHLLVSLGDIFVNPKNQLWMVLNPECDLAYAPKSKGRKFSKTKSIVLMPGKLQKLTHPTSNEEEEGGLRTELFVHEGIEYRINWDTKRVITKPYGDLKDWLEDEGYRRAYRLRLMYALQAQQKFTADFGRVGPPVAPPIFVPATVEVLSFDERNLYRTVVESTDVLAALVNVKDGRSCLFDLGLLEALLTSSPTVSNVLDQRIAQYQSRIAEASNANNAKEETPAQMGRRPRVEDVEKLEERLSKFEKFKALLNSFLDNRQAQIDLVSVNHPIHPPGTTEPIAGADGLFEIGFECNFTGQYKSKSLFVVSVKTKRTDNPDELAGTKQPDQ